MKSSVKKAIAIVVIVLVVIAIPAVSFVSNKMAPSEKGHAFSFDNLFNDNYDTVDVGCIDSVDDFSMYVGEGANVNASLSDPSVAEAFCILYESTNPSVATVDQDGFVSGISEGTTNIIMTEPNLGYSRTITVTIKARLNESDTPSTDNTFPEDSPIDFVNNQEFAFTNKEITLSIGETITIQGDVNLFTLNLQWTSSDSSIVSVDANGNVTGISAGTAIITGTNGIGLTDFCTVNVKMPPVSVDISNTSVNMKIGDVFSLSAVAQPEGLVDRPIIRWSSNNESVATVDRSGVITAISEGTAIISAKTYNAAEATCTVTITSDNNTDQNQSFSIVNKEIEVDMGQMTSVFTNVHRATLNITWTSSDESIAVIDNSGNVEGISGGTAIITGTLRNGYSDSCTIYVKEPPRSIDISTDRAEIVIGDKFQLSAIAQPVETVDRPMIRWASDNESIATVDRSGLVTAISEGTAYISAKTYNGIETKCCVEVKSNIVKIESISVSEDRLNLYEGENANVTVEVTPSNATYTLSWESLNPQIATVDNNGNIHAISKGEATITASISDSVEKCKYLIIVKVMQKPVEATDIHIISYSNVVRKSSTLPLECVITPNTISCDLVTWESSNESVAKVSSDGCVTPVAKGTTTITARIGNVSHSKQITVIANSAPYLYIGKPYIVLKQGKNQECKEYITNGNREDIVRTFSNPNVAYFSANCVNAAEVGITEMTVTLPNGASATSYIVVEPTYDVTAINIDNGISHTLKVGDSVAIKAVYYPDYAINHSLTWQSLDESVATVDQTGYVTAHSAGSTTIEVSAPSGVTKKISITVKDYNSSEWTFLPNNEEKNTFDITVGTTRQIKYSSIPNGLKISSIKSYDETCVLVSSDYKTITGVTVGSTFLYGKLSDGRETEIEIRVLPTEEFKRNAVANARLQVLGEINKERVAAGLKPYRMDETLNTLAQTRSDEMKVGATISHTRPDGRKWSTVFTDYGVRSKYSSIGENVLGTNIAIYKLVPLWMGSTSHKNAILSDRYEVTGIGITFYDDFYKGAYSACELFAIEK